MDLPELILASTSRYRREQLERLGLTFRSVAPACDEEAIKQSKPAGTPPRELAEALALAKAESLRATLPEAVIIGGDQIAAIGDTILGKPGNVARAREQLTALSGREHVLVTAIAVVHRGHLWRHTDVATLRMRQLDPEQIHRYVDRDHPLDCAGSYKLERRGVALFERIACEDHSAITGLPLMALARILAEIGYRIP